MRRFERNTNIAVATIPFLGLIASGVLLWNSLLGPLDVAIFAGMYIVSMLGITLGFHRLLTHRAFRTHSWVRDLLALAGAMALQGPVINWVADHRKHHTFTDEEGDPHSPHASYGEGLRGMVRGLWHAHVGWLFRTHGQASTYRFAKDLVDDRRLRFINKYFRELALLSIALPPLLGFALSGGSGKAALTAFLWAGLARVFIAHHVTWSINSVCHFFGSRRFDVEDESRNVFLLALPSMGEAWHNNHHAFPQSAFHGMRWFELDPSAWVIRLMEKVGLVWDVVRISPEKERAKLAVPAGRS
jgi:stearoyl-CoA desaturase (delta-9 desaturase)